MYFLAMTADEVDRDTALQQLDRVLASAPFRQAERSAGLLRYLVERSLSGTGDRVKEYTIGIEALGRGTDFDPRTNPIVRAEASRLRGRLERYYAGDGQSDAVVIELPKGAYTPRFHQRALPVAPPPHEAPVDRPEQRSHRRPVLWGALAAVAVVAAFGAGMWRGRSSTIAREPALRFEVQLQSDEQIASDVGTNVVVSPDGSRAVFVSIDSLGVTHLRARRFAESAPIDLPGTAGARGPFWSPDSRWIGFWAARQLRKISVDGGSPVVLCDAADLLGASWSADGSIVAALDATGRLWRVDALSGGKPVVVVDLTVDNAVPRWPQVLPGGKAVLYTAMAGVTFDQGTIEVASLTDRSRRVLVKGATFGRFVAPHHLTFINQGTLYALRFDPASQETRGARAPILDDVSYSSTFGYAEFSVAESGLAVYRRAPPNGPVVVALVDSAGRRTPLLDTPGQYAWPSLSPDGRRLALSVTESGISSLSVFTDMNERPRVAWTAPGYDAPVWTHDGRQLVARGPHGVVWFPASGGEARTLIANEKISVPWSFDPGDRRLALAIMDTATVFDVWMTAIEKRSDTLRASPPTAVLSTRFFETYPAISPDGRWLAYGSNESGSAQVYVRALADTGAAVPVGIGGVPRWSRDGSRLFFATPDQRMMVVAFTSADGRFVPRAPRQWTRIVLANTGVLPNYDLGADGGSIVALLSAGSRDVQAANHITLIQGLSDEIRRRAP